jgi:type I restriction enzyme S subunit
MNIDREGRFDLTSVKFVEETPPRFLGRGDVLFNNTNSPELIGKTTAIRVDTKLAYSNHMTRIRLEAGLNPVFVAHQLHFLWMSGYFRHRCQNHVNQASISTGPLSDTVPLVVAPPREQGRIADTIDELLSDLDAGVAALERVQIKLKHYRAAVLKAAVEGALTTNWRAKNPATESASDLLTRILAERRRRWEDAQLQKFKKGREPAKNWKAKYEEPAPPDVTSLPALPAGWCWVTLNQVLWQLRSGTAATSSRGTTNFPVLRSSAVRHGAIDLGDLNYLEQAQSLRHDNFLATGDLLITRLSGSVQFVGCSAVVKSAEAHTIQYPDRLFCGKLVALADGSFLTYVFQSARIRRTLEDAAKSTAGHQRISMSDLIPLVLPLPPVAEQEAIIEVVDDQLSVIEHLDADLEAKLVGAQALRQSILRQAFTGQLVPQDPTDESAAALLNRISAERELLTLRAAKERPTKAKRSTRRNSTKAVVREENIRD